MRHWNLLSPLARARMELHALREQKAPAAVQIAAEQAIEAAEEGRAVPFAAQATLMGYAAQQQRQNRYGK